MLGAENERTILKKGGVPMIGLGLTAQPGANNLDIAEEFYKRLEEGVFKLPRVQEGTASVELRASELAMLLDGIDLRVARIVDGSRLDEFKARYGSTLVCGASGGCVNGMLMLAEPRGSCSTASGRLCPGATSTTRPPAGAVLPPTARLTAVREQPPLTQLNGYVEATPEVTDADVSVRRCLWRQSMQRLSDMKAHDAEMQFKAQARRDRLLGLWVAGRFGLSGEAAQSCPEPGSSLVGSGPSARRRSRMPASTIESTLTRAWLQRAGVSARCSR